MTAVERVISRETRIKGTLVVSPSTSLPASASLTIRLRKLHSLSDTDADNDKARPVEAVANILDRPKDRERENDEREQGATHLLICAYNTDGGGDGAKKFCVVLLAVAASAAAAASASAGIW